MAIFSSVFESTNTEDILDAELETADIETPEMSGEDGEGDDIVSEFCRDAYMLEASMYVMDVQLETSVAEGASIESVMENVFTDLIAKAKKKILELWEKLKETITNLRVKFKAFSAASVNFVKKHENQIIEKYKKNPKYEFAGYHYDDKAFEMAAGVVDDIRDKAYKAGDSSNEYDMNIALANIGQTFKGKVPNSSGADRAFDDLDTGSVAALGAVILAACRGEENKEPATTDETTVKRWISTCKAAEDVLKETYNHEASAKKQISDIIADLKKAEKKAKDAEKNASNKSASAEISNTIKFNTALAAVIGKVTTVIINARVEQYKAYSRRLKEIYALKDKKEATQESFNLLNDAFAGLFV